MHHMSTESEMSLVGELTSFMGLVVRHMSIVSFISQSKYAKNLIKKFGIESATHVIEFGGRLCAPYEH